MRSQATAKHSEADADVCSKATLHCIPMHKETKKVVVDDSEKIKNTGGIQSNNILNNQEYEE